LSRGSPTESANGVKRRRYAERRPDPVRVT